MEERIVIHLFHRGYLLHLYSLLLHLQRLRILEMAHFFNFGTAESV